ncbi:unnamed protein product [Durusdinium trenchii]|uniref:Uncharacterized protein n=2 Tax=Durusdinium trenchii TaxID=1381693 RepID=A0ABP0M0A8_9DINO
MVSSPFSLGNEFLAESTDTYLREKFAKAKGKAKAKVPKRSGGNRGNDSLGAPGRSIGPQQQEDLDEAERDLLGLPKAPPRAKSPRPEMELLPLEAGAALRLAASGASVSSKRCCPDGHQLFCYIVARSAALCDTCDTMQKPGEVVFGCSTCDSELCAKCAVETASSTEEADESRELIARVTQMYSGEKCTRFVATPSGAVLDTLDTHQQPELRDKGPEEKLESSTQASDKKENREAAKPPQLPARTVELRRNY